MAARFGAVYDVTAEGDWEGHNILHRVRPYEQEAKLLGLSEEDLRRRLDKTGPNCRSAQPAGVAAGRATKKC